MALAPGSIAFTGFSADDSDALTFVALTDVAAGTVINFTSGLWGGDRFRETFTEWSWTATSAVTAGTIVTMDMRDGAAPASNLGDIAVMDADGVVDFSGAAPVYAYVGAHDAPETFLSAITGFSFDGLSTWRWATLDGTGLTEGVNAVSLGFSTTSSTDIGAYNGPRLGAASFEDYLSLINDKANWDHQTGLGDLTGDGIAPDLPLSLAGFSDDPNVQVVDFAAESLEVSQAEGNGGESILTFTVERTGGTTGLVNFTGTIAIDGTTRADDFGGTAPLTFAGTIEAGQSVATVTVRVSGDVMFERDEKFTLSLQGVSNDDANAVLGEHTVATGAIVNDDPAPASIAFVGYNAEGTDNLTFLAASDIAAGTIIHFNTNGWTGSSFDTGQGAWSWTAGSDIAAGTIISLDGLSSGAATSSHGTISFTSGTDSDVLRDDLGEVVYAYMGTPEQPTAFLTAMATGSFQQLLAGTGLTEGINALALASSRYVDIAQYNGPRVGEVSFADYLAHTNDPANWVVQGNFSQDTSADGVFPDAPLQTLRFSTDPTVQVIQFAAGSLAVSQNEGATGTETAFTFTVERTNGTEGDLAFSVRVPFGTYATAANGADFSGDALPVVTGTIPDGQASATVTILVKGENLYEVNERFLLALESASNPDASSVVIGNNWLAAATIDNDDTQPARVLAGEHHTAPIRLTGDTHFVIEDGGSTEVITWRGDANIVIDNGGETGTIGASGGSGGSVTINNLATGVIRGIVSAEDAGRTNYTLNNAGRIELFGDRMDLRDPADDGADVVVNNLSGGVIVQTDAREDIIRPGANGVINNYGTIQHSQDIAGGSSDGIDYQNDPGVVNNYAGGVIEASRHAVTGDAPVALLNEGTMIGRNGSAINIDSNGSEEERVFVTNHGRMEGRSAHLADSDGDAVDIDGLLTLENYGFIGGMGHNGYHDGEPNVSEGIAIGGGTITNHAGGEIYGYGRAIQVDNSSNANALGTTTIVNNGVIRGDGNGPSDVTPEEQALFAERIRGGEAINLLGNYGDSLTNTGQIIGGVKMGGGDDVVVNEGMMAATGGSAVNLGDGNDTFEQHAGSTVTGLIDGGEGSDTLKLMGSGVGSLGANTNFETLDVQGGMWSLQSDAYDTVDVATGAMVMSQLELADQGALNVAAGGAVLVTNGSDAVVSQGAADIENAGLIQALGTQGAAPARAINLSGGSVYNKMGAIILAQGAVIASQAAAAQGVEIVNEGLMQSLSGEAIVLDGDEGDLLVNTRTGAINGSVSTGGGNDLVTNQGSVVAATGTAFDLGDGNDTLNLHEGSAVTGKIVLGAGNDVLSSQSASDLVIEAGDGQDSIATGEGNDRIIGGAGIDLVHAGGGDDIVDGGADDDRLQGGEGDDRLLGGAGDDVLIGGAGDDLLDGGDGIDTADYAADRAGITVDFNAGTAVGADAGSDELSSIETVIGGSGNDTFLVSTAGPLPTSIDGGAGDDTVNLLGGGSGALAATAGIENLVVQQGSWSVAASDYSSVTIEDGGTVTSTVALNNDDRLTVEAGGKLVASTAITWSGGGDVVVENSGLIEASSRVLNTTNGAAGSFTFNNDADGVVHGQFSPQQRAAADATVTINNAGLMEASGRVMDFQNLAAGGADVVINNLAGGTIRQTGSDTDVIRPGQNTVVNNWGTITTAPGFAGGGDLIDFQGNSGGKVNNHAGGWMEGSRHVVTGDESVTVVNDGTMIGRNGSAVNIDNGGSEADKVFITNRGTMEGRSAELSDSDGDAVDVDGLAQILNYGRIAGLGAEGYHDGEPNVSEAIAIGGGTIVNNATGEIHGYGRAIQVDNSSNENALGATTIVNDGLIRGDGHGPEGVNPEDAADFDLRGNEAINLVGEFEDWVINNSAGRIVGGISMGGARDTLNNSGAIIATGGSAIDMGAGNDQVNLYVGSTVEGTILLGDGDDVASSTSASAYVIDGGNGDDTISMYYTIFGGDDVLFGGAGNDHIYGGLGEDRIDGGLDNDVLFGETGDDLIEGGAGDDTIDGGADDDVIFGDAGNDTIVGGLGNDTIKGGADDDTFVITTTADGRDSYDGGAGVDTLDFGAVTTAVNLTLRDGASTYASDTIENIENVIGGAAGDRLTGNALANMLTGNAGDDTLRGGAGDDVLNGGAGNDTLDGGADNDQLSGGLDDDALKGAAGDDTLDGGEGNDSLDGGAGDDALAGGAGDDTLKGGAGNDVLTGGEGADILTGGAGNDTFVFVSVSDSIDTITDFRVSGSSADQLQLSAGMFESFSGDDAFDLIGSGFLRAVASGGTTQLQVDVDGGGDNFVALADLNGTFSNGTIADHLIVHQDLLV